MTSETDEQFLDSMEQWVIGSLVFKAEHRKRLFALARRGAAVDDVVEAAMWAIDHVARYNSPERITEARALVRRVALPHPPAGETE